MNHEIKVPSFSKEEDCETLIEGCTKTRIPKVGLQFQAHLSCLSTFTTSPHLCLKAPKLDYSQTIAIVQDH